MDLRALVISRYNASFEVLASKRVLRMLCKLPTVSREGMGTVRCHMVRSSLSRKLSKKLPE